jgi:hypothetical protein
MGQTLTGRRVFSSGENKLKTRMLGRTAGLLTGSLLMCLVVDATAASFGRECFVNSAGLDFLAASSRITLRGSTSRARQSCARMNMFPDTVGDFKKGDKVKVAVADVVFTHVAPKDNPDGYKVPVGLEGEAKFSSAELVITLYPILQK